MQKAKGNHHKMSKTSEVQPKPNGEPSPEKDNLFTKAARKLGEVALYTWRVVTGRGSDEQAKDISGTIAPEAPVKSGDTSPIANTMSEEQLKSLEALGVKVIATPEYPVYLKSSLPEPVTTPDGRQYPVYPKPSFPKSVTTPDGRQHPVYPKPSFPKSVTTPDGRQRPAEIEPPKPTPLDMLIDKRKGEAAAAAAAAKYSSSVNPDVYTRVKGENVIDKGMFSTTIPNVDKSKKDDNPEGLTPYEQAMRDKYLGDEHDDAEKTEMSPEEHEAAANLKIARERFAKASIAVESHFFKKFFGGKKRQAELEAATEQLKQCELKYMSLKFADKIEAAKQDPEKQAELAAEMAQAAFASMQETSRMTTDKYDNMLDDRGKFKKAAAKVGKWFNKGGKIAQWLKLGGAGLVVGTATGTFAGIAGWPITTAVGIVTKLGVAGATKQAVLEEHRGEDRIDADASLGTIDPSFEKAVANMKIDDVMKRAVNVSVDNLKGVSTERRDALRKKVISSSGKYAVGFVLGGVVGSFINDWWANSARATGDSASQSGGKELKTHLLEKVKNTAPGSADPVGNYTPGLDSLYGYDPSKHEFLWQWAESVYGEGNGTSGIMHTVDVLRDNGYIVDIINNPNGSFSVVVDGVSDTEGLVKIFSQFVN